MPTHYQPLVWTQWVRSYEPTTCTACSETWIVWNQTATTTNATVDPWPLWSAASITPSWTDTLIRQSNQLAAQATPEQIRAQLQAAEERLRRRNEANAAYLQAEGERAQARERAERLLMSVLTDQQREELRAHGYFTVHPSRPVLIGERYHYRIRRGRSQNIQRVSESGRHLGTLCAHPIEAVPDADTMIAQKLWIETREADLLRVANHS